MNTSPTGSPRTTETSQPGAGTGITENPNGTPIDPNNNAAETGLLSTSDGSRDVTDETSSDGSQEFGGEKIKRGLDQLKGNTDVIQDKGKGSETETDVLIVQAQKQLEKTKKKMEEKVKELQEMTKKVEAAVGNEEKLNEVTEAKTKLEGELKEAKEQVSRKELEVKGAIASMEEAKKLQTEEAEKVGIFSKQVEDLTKENKVVKDVAQRAGEAAIKTTTATEHLLMKIEEKKVLKEELRKKEAELTKREAAVTKAEGKGKAKEAAKKVKTAEMIAKAKDGKDALNVAVDAMYGKFIDKKLALFVAEYKKITDPALAHITEENFAKNLADEISKQFAKVEKPMIDKMMGGANSNAVVAQIQKQVFDTLKDSLIKKIEKGDIPGLSSAQDKKVFGLMFGAIKAIQDPMGTLEDDSNTWFALFKKLLASGTIGLGAGLFLEAEMVDLPKVVVSILGVIAEYTDNTSLHTLGIFVGGILFLSYLAMQKVMARCYPDNGPKVVDHDRIEKALGFKTEDVTKLVKVAV